MSSVESSLSSFIPQHLLSKILLLLPLKTLARSRSVSKSWNSLISSPDFIHEHIQSTRFESDSLLVLSKLNRFPIDEDPIYDLYSPPENSRRKLKQLPNPSEYGSFPVGVVHGVVCISRITLDPPARDVILWNPITRKQICIPDTNYLMVEGFGYDPLTKQLKVVATRKNHRSVEVQVVSHRDRKWKSLSGGSQSNLLGIDKDEMVFGSSDYDGCRNWLRYDHSNKGSVMFEHHYYEGFIHWLRNNGSGWVLIAFDCGKDEFRTLDLPQELVDCKPPRRMIWGPRGQERPDYDKLVATQCGALFSVHYLETDSDSRRNLHIWVMYEYGDPNSWMKLFTVPLEGGFVNVRMLWEDEEALLWLIDVYNSASFDFTGTVVKNRIQHPNGVFDAYAFKDSLLLMDS